MARSFSLSGRNEADCLAGELRQGFMLATSVERPVLEDADDANDANQTRALSVAGHFYLATNDKWQASARVGSDKAASGRIRQLGALADGAR